MTSAPRPEYTVHTTDIPFEAFRHLVHPMDASNERYTVSLGDSTGLTKLGVHFCRLPPGATSSTLHYHTNDEEWYYIIDAGGDDSGAVVLLWEPPADGEESTAEEGEGDKEAARVREEKIRAGDFLGFKAGTKGVHAHAHALRAGSKEVVYLVGGTREPVDSSVYPLLGNRILVDRTQGEMQTWTVKEKDLTPIKVGPPRVV
ncbi:hypothetical protein C8Q77DRAFT_1103553 [Trametes polyzona]|nr:hypothetical protein C8Q77DRAFT_1103553 [Trametes polyzona]